MSNLSQRIIRIRPVPISHWHPDVLLQAVIRFQYAPTVHLMMSGRNI